MPRTIVIGVSGVGQRFAPRTDGVRSIVDELRREGREDCYYLHWCDDVQVLAESMGGVAHRYVLFGHSRGVEACCNFAEALDLPVYALCSADGWYRTGNLSIPANIERLYSWRQRHYWPRGSAIELAAPGVTQWLIDAKVSGVKHMDMDELPQFREKALKLARGEL